METQATGANAPQKTVDEFAKELYEKVKADKLAVAQAEKPCWATSGSFRFSADSAHNPVNIFTHTDTRKLVEILAFLTDREKNYKEAAEVLGVNSDFTWLSFSVEEWTSDLKTRVNQIQLASKKKKLAELEAKLETLLSPELKRKLELDAIQEALTS